MASRNSEIEIKDILKRLEETESNIKYGSNKDVILILGNAGSGKSSFTQYLAENDHNSIPKSAGQDPGEFNTIGNNNKINSTSTGTSQTVYPKLVLDTRNNITYYDCPGFNDTRNAADDISATYFTKKIIDFSESVKLVFAVDYSSFREKEDKPEFMLLVKHAVQMIQNINKFQRSIALVVTNVNKYKNKNNEFLSDERIKKNVAKFIKNRKERLLKTSNESSDKVVQFIDILLDKNHQGYTKIGIFTRPNKLGVLGDVSLSQDSIISLKKILHENLEFTKLDESDFRFTISSVSQNYIHGLMDEINDNIASHVKFIGQEIKNYYNFLEAKSHDIEELCKEFHLGYNVLSAMETAKFVKPQDLEKITKNLKVLNSSITMKELSNIISLAGYLKFFTNISDQLTIAKPLEWSQEFSEAVKYLNDSQKWYRFLINLHDILSNYDIHRDISTYETAANNFRDQTSHENLDENDHPKIIESLKSFLGMVIKEKKVLEKEYDNIKDVKLSESETKLEILNDLLTVTLKYKKPKYLCIKDKLKLSGQYVMLSKITNKTCTGAKFIEIFALDRVFIDADHNVAGNQVQLTIIAPTWEIINSPNIILDGMPGKPHDSPQPPDARGVEKVGNAGEPGLPGGPGGNFIGIGKHFINGKNLTVSVKGGKGGPGQCGGRGGKGKDGEDPQLPYDESTDDPAVIWKGRGFKVSSTTKPDCGIATTHTCNKSLWHVYGTNCTDGGVGGVGGIKGIGGNPGSVLIIPINKNSYKNFSLIEAQGDDGIDGCGGEGGPAGETGKILTAGASESPGFKYYVIPAIKYTFNLVENHDYYTKHCKSDKSGIAGQNKVGIKHPIKPAVVYVPTVINDFKVYLRENMSDIRRKSSLEKFLKDLEKQESVKNAYDLLAFINEFQGLEDQFYRLRESVSFLPFYESLKNRIDEYFGKFYNEGKMTEEYKKVVSYLYTAILSKIYSLNHNTASSLIIDLEQYVEGIEKNIETLKDFRNVVEIQTYQTNYQNIIESKTLEAQNFIKEEVITEINNIFVEIEKQIELWINEVIAQQHVSEEDKIKLIMQRSKLEDALVLRRILGITKIASQFLNFLGPAGTTAGAAIGAGIKITEVFALEDGSNQLALIPKAIQDSAALSHMTDALKSKKVPFNKQLDDAKLTLDKISGDQTTSYFNIDVIKKKIVDSKLQLQKEREQGNSLDSDIINDAQNELVEFLQKQQNELLEKQKLDNDEKIANQIEIVGHVQKIVGITHMSADLYDKVRNDTAKINAVSDAIKQADNKVKELMQYEKKLYDIIIPTFRTVKKTVMDVDNNLQDESHVAIDVNQWKVQSTVKDVKFLLRKMIEEFKAKEIAKVLEVQENLQLCLDKLEAGITTMTDTYNRIADYRTTTELAAHIANIISNRSKGIAIMNPELDHAVNNLQLIIQSNLVLEQYESAMEAIRHFVYPFADIYAHTDKLPSYLASNDTSTLVSKATNSLKSVISKINKFAGTLHKEEDYKYYNRTFDSQDEKNRNKPFFVWEYNEYKHSISQLLEGKEITLDSDIKKSPPYNAIKFNSIHIHLKLANKTVQHELDEELTYFKVIMKHLGNSHYRCNNKFHTFISESRSNEYSDVFINGFYVFTERQPVLSPYASWTMQIIPLNETENRTLAKYRNQAMDLELVGKGQYVGGKLACDHLDEYYTADDTIFDINNINISENQNLPNVSGISSRIVSNNPYRDNHVRRRRGIDNNDRIQDINESSFATSGASSNIKSSFMNNIFNLIGISSVLYEYLNQVKKITDWFTEDNIDIDREVLNEFDTNNPIGTKLANIECPGIVLPKMSNLSVGNESATISNVLDISLLCNHGNLLLLDLIIRRKSGVKHKYKSNVKSRDSSLKCAQKLAYRQYVSKNA